MAFSKRKTQSPYDCLNSMSFRIYTPDEIKQLSVKEITNPETFDILMHPNPNGLHDLALGPSERNDVCSTCNMNDLYCPGHMGHISLPVPVYNPVFFQLTHQLVVASCLNCHKLLFSSDSSCSRILLAQLRCIRAGKLSAAAELQELVGEGARNRMLGELEPNVADLDDSRLDIVAADIRPSTSKSTKAKPKAAPKRKKLLQELHAKPDTIIRIEEILRKAFDEDRGDLAAGMASAVLPSAVACSSKDNARNALEMENELLQNFKKQYLLKRRGVCPFCCEKVPVVRREGNRRIVVGNQPKVTSAKARTSTKKGAAARKEEIVAAEKENEDVAFDPFAKPGDQHKAFQQRVLTAQKCREDFQLLWQNEKNLLQEVFPGFIQLAQPQQQLGRGYSTRARSCSFSESCPLDALFTDVVAVPPTKFRPIAHLQDRQFENPQTANLRKILELSTAIRTLLRITRNEPVTDAEETYVNRLQGTGATPMEKLQILAIRLQMMNNALYDGTTDKSSRDKPLPGIRQILEKKEGMFRKFMMGKRVNYAARSVISPDPYIEVDEVGVPEIFAKKLTYPEPVNSRNLSRLREAVINGPEKYPGASFVLNEDGTQVLLNPGDRAQREGEAKRLFKHATDSNVLGVKKVLRHLTNGDILLMNRQPSLHKPSIMAHKARVLKGEKTLRLNYSTCKTYNADFDGDEMNAHFPQNEVARAEGLHIGACALAKLNAKTVAVPHQYLVPKDGTPLAGLIQDHVISGVLLTIKDTFLTRQDYQHLVYSAFPNNHRKFKIIKPTIILPERLWTGKQVVSTVILNVIPDSSIALSIEGKSKTAVKNWSVAGMPSVDFTMSESEVIIRKGELLCGVLDKADYGPSSYGLVHCCFELYGAKVAAHLLSCLARLFTTFLQLHGFSLGVEDILVTSKADRKREKIIERLRQCGPLAVQKAFNIPDEVMMNAELADAAVRATIAKAHASKDPGEVKQLDFAMKKMMDSFNDKITKTCIPDGLLKTFPKNSLQLMIESGAKGSVVNAVQISCLLGQIELEGARPPVMASGRSLPSFAPYDPSPRAGGFVDQRFLTGIRPQEYFFHCMAGREGLIDTAVKTSRSGYLQRCIIKHLEGLVVGYDLTVRNVADSSVIQFQYGEDSHDICKVPFLNEKQFPFLVENADAVMKHARLAKLKQAIGDGSEARIQNAEICEKVAKIGVFKQSETPRRSALTAFADYLRKRGKPVPASADASQAARRFSDLHLDQSLVNKFANYEALVQAFYQLKRKKIAKLKKLRMPETSPDPLASAFRQDRNFGVLPEKLFRSLEKFVSNPKYLSGDCLQGITRELPVNVFKEVVEWKSHASLVDPGEPVGLLAAQSIGEPSTQMTLNTFHFAGRGEMNVTLGIPRLREILMTASKSMATPTAQCPFLPETSKEAMAAVCQSLNRVFLKDVLKSVEIVETVSLIGNDVCRRFEVKFKLLKEKHRPPHASGISCAKVLSKVERSLIKQIGNQLKRKQDEMLRLKAVHNRRENASDLETVDHLGRQPAETDEGAEREMPPEANLEETEVMESNEEGEEAQAGGDSSDEEVEGMNDVDADEARSERKRDNAGNEYTGEEEEMEVLSEKEEQADEEFEDPFAEEDDDAEGEGQGLGVSALRQGHDENEIFDAELPQQPERLMQNRNRIMDVIESVKDITDDYEYDSVNERWCKVTFRLALRKSKVDAIGIIEDLVEKCVIQSVPPIEKAFVVEENGVHVLKTQGVNLQAMYLRAAYLDVSKIYSNDIHLISTTYGIEAAGQVIIQEMKNVFGNYGIRIDGRHLSLIADYMTQVGEYRPFNRKNMECAPSPLQKMTFETTMHFLRNSIIAGQADELNSPSACLVVGKLTKGGTGSFDLLADLSASVNKRTEKTAGMFGKRKIKAKRVH